MENKDKAGSYQKESIDFLLYSVLGDIEDPVLAAIDRAYRDMAAHTINADKNREKIPQEKIYDNRKCGSDYLYNQINEYTAETDFDKWHKKICNSKKLGAYTIGQRQKWLNMTLKYLFVMYELGVDGINEALMQKYECFHAPIDSYVEKYIGCDDNDPWSNIESYDNYLKLRDKTTFIEELTNWQAMAKQAKYKKNGELKVPEKGTYERYLYDLKDKTQES